MPILEMTKQNGQDGKKYNGGDDRKVYSEFIKTNVGDGTEQNYGKEDQLFVRYREGDIFYRKQKENNQRLCKETYWKNLKDRIKEICKRICSQASDEFKRENMHRRNKATTPVAR